MRISLDQSNGILRLMICRRCFGNPKFHSQEKKHGIRRCAWIFRLTLKESTSMCDDLEDESIDRLDESLVPSFGSMEIYGSMEICGIISMDIYGFISMDMVVSYIVFVEALEQHPWRKCQKQELHSGVSPPGVVRQKLPGLLNVVPHS